MRSWSAEQYKAVVGRHASGVSVVTAVDSEGPVGLTCQAFFSLSLDPPLVAFAPGKVSSSWPRILTVGRFCLNILNADQEGVGRSFSLTEPDKFAGVEWEATPGGSPQLSGSLAWLECLVEESHEAGDHYLVVGRVVDIGAGRGEPLIFYRGAFGVFSVRGIEPPGAGKANNS